MTRVISLMKEYQLLHSTAYLLDEISPLEIVLI